MHKHTRTHTQTHIHTHPFTRTPVTHTNPHASTRSHAHTYAYTLTQTLRTVPLCQRTNSVRKIYFAPYECYFAPCEWVRAHMNESPHTYEGVMAHIWKSHGTVPLYQRTNSSMEMLFCASFIISSACVCVYASARLISWIWSMWKCTVFVCVCICEYNRRC